jgi:hypothetical protein
MNETSSLQLLDCSGNRRSRDTEFLNQAGLRRNAISGLVIARLNSVSHNLEHLPVFGGNWCYRGHFSSSPGENKTVVACRNHPTSSLNYGNWRKVAIANHISENVANI